MVEFTDAQFLRLLSNAKTKNKGSLWTCTEIYNGEKDREVLEMFLTAVEVHKSVEMMSDAETLAQLHLVLKQEAGEWWERIKSGVDSWPGFRSKICREFAPMKPDYMIYQDIITSKQQPYEVTEHYIAKKKLLFSQLSTPEPTEQQQIDMIYGGLRLQIRQKILRSMINSFEDLLEAAKDIEKYLELQDEAKQIIPKYARNNVLKKKPCRLRCSFCRLRGHAAEVCLKKKKKMIEEDKNKNEGERKNEEVKTNDAVIQKSDSSDTPNSDGHGTPNVTVKSEPE